MLENPSIDILGTQIRLLNKNYDFLLNKIRPTQDQEIKKCLLKTQNVVAHPSVLFKKSILLRTVITLMFIPLQKIMNCG